MSTEIKEANKEITDSQNENLIHHNHNGKKHCVDLLNDIEDKQEEVKICSRCGEVVTQCNC